MSEDSKTYLYKGKDKKKGHPHPMIRKGTGGFGCDGHCSVKVEERYECTVCKGRYTVCEKCIKESSTECIPVPESVTTVTVSDHDHPLQRAGQGGFGCDSKRPGASHNKERWKCSQRCNYDFCGNCVYVYGWTGDGPKEDQQDDTNDNNTTPDDEPKSDVSPLESLDAAQKKDYDSKFRDAEGSFAKVKKTLDDVLTKYAPSFIRYLVTAHTDTIWYLDKLIEVFPFAASEKNVIDLRQQTEELFAKGNDHLKAFAIKDELKKCQAKMKKVEKEDPKRWPKRITDAYQEIEKTLEKLRSEYGAENKSLVEFEDDYNFERARMLKLVDEATAEDTSNRIIKSLKAAIKDGLFHADPGRTHKVPGFLEKMDALLDDINGNSVLSSYPTILDYLPEYEAGRAEIERKYRMIEMSKVGAGAVRTCKAALTQAKDGLYHSNFPKALEGLQKAQDLFEDCKDSRFFGIAVVDDFREEYATLYDKYSDEYSATMSARECAEAVRGVASSFTQVKSHFDHHRYEACTTELQKVKDHMENLSANFGGMDTAEDTLAKYEEQVREFCQTFSSHMKERAMQEEIRGVKSAINFAEGHLEHSRHEAFLKSIKNAEDLLESILENESSFPELEDFKTSLAKLTTQYRESVLSKEAANLIAEAGRDFTSVRNNLEKFNMEAALKAMTNAVSKRNSIASNDQFQEMKSVEEFLTVSTKTLDELREGLDKERRRKEGLDLHSKLSQALNAAQHNCDQRVWDRMLKAMEETRDILDEIALTNLLETEGKLKELVDSASTKIVSLNETYEKEIIGKEISTAKRDVATHITAIKDALEHSNHPKALQSLSASRSALENLGSLRHNSEVLSVYEEFENQIGEMEKKADSFVAAKEAADAVRECRTTFDSAKALFDKYRFEESLSKLQIAESKRVDLLDERYADQEEVKKFLVDVPVKSFVDFKKDYAKTMKEREYKESQSQATKAVDGATNHLEHSRLQSALKSIAEASGKLEDIKVDFGELGASFVQDCQSKIDGFKKKYAEVELNKRLGAAKRDAQTNLDAAKDAFEKFMFEKSLTSLSTAKTSASDIVGDEMFIGIPEVEEFFVEFSSKAEKLEGSISEKMNQRMEQKAQVEVERKFEAVKNTFEHSQWEKCAKALVEARGLLEDVSYDSFKSEMSKNLTEFDQKLIEAHYKREIDRRKRACEGPLSAASDHAEHHHLEQASKCLSESRGIYIELASDERFAASSEFQSWLSAHYAKLVELSTKVDKIIAQKALDAAKHSLTSILNSATRALEHRTFEKFLSDVNTARDEVGDIDDANFVQECEGKIEGLQAKYVEVHAKKEIDELIRKANTYLNQSFDLLEHYNELAALATFEKAQDAATDLNQPNYNSVKSVQDFFTNYCSESKRFRTEYSERTQKKQRTEVMSNLTRKIKAASNASEMQCFEKALESCSDANDILGELQELTKESHSDKEKEINEIRVTVIEKAKSREIASGKAGIIRHLDQAERLLERYNPNGALEAFDGASDSFVEFKGDFDVVTSVSEFIGSTETRIETFRKQYATKVTASEIASEIGNINRKLKSAKDFLEKGVEEKALTQLHEVIGEVEELCSGMGGSLDEVKKLSEEVKKTRVLFADQFLSKRASKLVSQGKKVISQVQVTFSRGLPINETEWSSVIEVVEEIREDSLFNDLPLVSNFLKEAETIASTVNKSLETSGGSGSQKKGAGFKSSILALCGGSIWPKKLNTVAKIVMDTSVDANFYQNYKKLNNAVGGLNKYVRALKRVVDAVDLDALEFSVRRSIGDVECELSGIIAQQKLIGKEDPTLKNWEDQFNDFGVAFGECKKTWNRIKELIFEHKRIVYSMELLEDRYEGLMSEDFRVRKNSYGQREDCGRQTMLSQHPTMENLYAFSITRESLQDSEICLVMMDEYIPAMRRRIDEANKKFEGDIGAEATVERLDELYNLCRLRHPADCVMKAIREAGNLKSFKRYLDPLKNFPIARKYLLQAVKEYHEIYHDPLFEVTPLEEWINMDDMIAPAPKPYEEDESQYVFPEMIVPDSSNEIESSRNGEKLDIVWGPFRESVVGTIVFSKQQIARDVQEKDEFQTDFVYSDNISARAFWPQPLNSLTLARQPDGQPLFGPEEMVSDNHPDTATWKLKIMMDVYIDGKKIEREGRDSFCSFKQHGNSSKRDNFWSFSQTCQFDCQQHPCRDPYDSWSRASQRIMHHLVLAGAGKHEVKVEISFQMLPNKAAMANRVFPFMKTKKSAPIATGSFNITLDDKSVKPNLLPVCKQDGPIAKTMLDYYQNSREWGKRSDKTEVPIFVGSYKEWYVYSTEAYWEGNEWVHHPHIHAMPIYAMFYRSPMTGWPYEGVALFSRNALSCPGKGQSPSVPPLYNESGNNRMMFCDVDLLSEEELASFKRTCPEDKRKTYSL